MFNKQQYKTYKLSAKSYRELYWSQSLPKSISFNTQSTIINQYNIDTGEIINGKFIPDGKHAISTTTKSSTQHYDMKTNELIKVNNKKVNISKKAESKRLLSTIKNKKGIAPIDSYERKTMDKINTTYQKLKLTTSESINSAVKIHIRPMNLKVMKISEKINYNDYYFQAKIDGHRAFIDVRGKSKDISDIHIRTRSGFNSTIRPPKLLTNILTACQWISKTYDSDKVVFDGEFYNPDIDFESLSSIIRTSDTSSDMLLELDKIKLYLFDIVLIDVDIHMIGKNRKKILDNLFASNQFKYIVKVPDVENKDMTFTKLHAKTEELIRAGYEGIVIRSKYHPYMFGYRANKEIYKYKVLHEADYRIVGFTFGHTLKNAVVWICQLNDDQPDETFNVIPKSTIKYRESLGQRFKETDGAEYFNKFFKNRLITVYYNFKTKTGRPKPSIGSDVVKMRNDESIDDPIDESIE